MLGMLDLFDPQLLGVLKPRVFGNQPIFENFGISFGAVNQLIAYIYKAFCPNLDQFGPEMAMQEPQELFIK